MKHKHILFLSFAVVFSIMLGISILTNAFASGEITIELKRDLNTNGIYLKSNLAHNDQLMILVQYRDKMLKSVKIIPVNNGEGYSSSTDVCTDFLPTDLFKGFLWESKESIKPALISISALASEIEAPALWLDAADVSTLTLSNGNVSNWKDKSQNNRDVYQETDANMPLYNAEDKYVYTNGDTTTPTFLENRSPFISTNSHTLFFVGDFENLSTSNSSQYYIADGSSTDNYPCYTFFYHIKDGKYYNAAIRGTTSSMKKITVSNGYWAEGKQLHVYTDNKVTTKIASTVYRNDATVEIPEENYSDLIATTNAEFDIFSIGARRHYNNSLKTSSPSACKFREIIIYPGVLSEERINEVKEYLLNKWKIEPPIATADEGLVAGSLNTIALAPDAEDDKQYASYYLPEAALDYEADPVPLVVGLHSWGGSYKSDSVNGFKEQAEKYGWAMIHPDFRGPNTKPEACASELAISDIVNAVNYMKENANIDENRIYLIGASGGGHMSLMMAAKHPEIWAAVSAWVPITDLTAWYDFSLACNNDDIENNNHDYHIKLPKICGGAPGDSDEVDLEYYNRSPINFITAAIDVPLDINAGIKDGHGANSVPISHSLNAFNKMAEAGGYTDQIISEEDIAYMVANKAIPEGIATEPVDNNAEARAKAALFRRYAGNTRITLFNDGHTKDYPAAFKFCEDKVKGN
ncbi:MAG: hypothetical protein E7404_07915 [Ruminococcaceae bacterium]|nr:hypothetical protein [Oscillospiraceae bacterium]